MSGALPVDGAAQATAPISRRDSDRLLEAARAFESMLVQMMLREMRDAQLENGFFGGGTGAGIYEGLFERFLSDRLAEDSPFGITRELLRRWRDDSGAADEALRRMEQARGRGVYLEAALGADPETAAVTKDSLGSTDQIVRGTAKEPGVRDGD